MELESFVLYRIFSFRNGGSSNSPSTSYSLLAGELGAGTKFDITQLSEAAKEWLDARVTEQVKLL